MLSARGLRSKARGSARFQQIGSKSGGGRKLFYLLTWKSEKKYHGKKADGLWTSDRDPFLRQALDGPLTLSF